VLLRKSDTIRVTYEMPRLAITPLQMQVMMNINWLEGSCLWFQIQNRPGHPDQS
jgi:hypothetical protein